MSKKLASLLIKINADGANAKRVMTEMEGRVDKFAKNMQRVGTTLTRNLTLPLTALASAGIALANTQLQAEAKLLTALKGREDIQKRLIAQASALQARSTYGDEEIIAQQAILAAMGLTEEQIKRTIQAATELSAALGMDLSSAVRNLGKTYGGLTGELGEVIPALKDISAEALRNGAAIDYVNENYQGFAQTAAETGAGPLVQLKNKLGDLGEKIGTVLMPAFTALIDKVSRFIDLIAKMPDGLTKAVVGIGALAAVAGPLTMAFGGIIKLFSGALPLLTGLAAAFPAATAAVATFGPVVTAAALALGALVQNIIEIGEVAEESRRKVAEFYDEVAQGRATAIMEQAESMSEEEVHQLILDKQKELEEARQLEAFYKRAGATTVDYTSTLQAEILALEKVYHNKVAVREETERLAAAEAAAAREARNREAAQLAAARSGNTPIATNGVSFDGVSLKGGELAGEDWETALHRRWEKWENEANTIATRAVDLGDAVAAAFTDMAVTIGEGLGNMIAGEEFDWGRQLLTILGNLLKNIGKQLIVASGIIEKIKEALKGIIVNPAFGVIAGIAAIAAGSAMIAKANQPVKLAKGGLAYGPTLAVVGDNPGAANDPEVVAPLSKLRSYVGGQALELVGDVEFVVRGDTMRAVLNRENVRLSRLG